MLDPIHFGFTDSIVRYHELRRRLPEARIMMGVGNLTELTEADTTGINALLFGIVSELRVSAVLATEVSTQSVRERFRREAQAIATLKHPNIVQLLGYG